MSLPSPNAIPEPGPPSGTAPSPAGSAGADGRPALLAGWTRLVLEGRKFLVARGRSEIERLPRLGPGGEPEGAEVRVHSEARVFGRRVARHHAVSRLGAGDRVSGWLEWTEGRRMRRAVLAPGGRLQLTRFTPGEDGRGWLEGERREVALWPAGRGETALPAAGAPEGAAGGEAGAALDPYGVLGRLGWLLERGSGTLDLVTRRGAQPVAFEAGPVEPMRLRLAERGGPSRSVRLEARRLTLRPTEGDGPTLLQMEGPLELWVEEGSGALLRIRGRQPKIRGELTLRLSEYSRAPPARFELPVDLPDLSLPSEPAPCGDPPVAAPAAGGPPRAGGG